jgi:hypothetical protein
METCALCSASFDPAGLGCRPTCPLAKACTTVCCPNCGYSFPRSDSGLAGRLARWLKREAPHGEVS